MIFEERRALVKPERMDDYIAACRAEVWPAAHASGGEVICLLSGLIGNPQNEIVQVTAWQSLDAWQQAQVVGRGALSGMQDSENARLLRAISSRPKAAIPAEDRRPVYGFRRFLIEPRDIDEFTRCSENGIWPRIEAMGASILGLWTTIAATDPQEIVLATGYHSPSHWERTRYEGAPPDDIDRTLWDNEDALRRRRIDITLKSWVCLMRAHDV